MTVIAKEIMTSPVTTVTPQASVTEMAQILASKRISAIPVCNDDGTLAGIISENEIVGPFRESKQQQRNWWLTALAEGEDLSDTFAEYLRRDIRTAADLMERHVVSADEQATLPMLAELMVGHGVHRVPILREGKVVGIVSRSDLVRALAKEPAMLV